jgi:hypothetical protein
MSHHKALFPPKLQLILLLQVTVKRVITITPKSMRGMEGTPPRSQKGDGGGGGGRESEGDRESEEGGGGDRDEDRDENKDEDRGHGEDQALMGALEHFKQKKYKNTL